MPRAWRVCRGPGTSLDAIGGAIALADIRIAQGRLREAMRTYEQALQLAAEQGEPALRGTADMYVGMSELHREHNDLHAATQHLLRSKELGEHTGFPQNPYRWRVAMARIREAEGDLDGALDLLDEAERLYMSDFFPNVRPVAALKARVWVAQGRLGEALGWAREQGLSAEDDLSYLREFEHITLARVLLARYKSDRADRSMHEAMGLLERLLQAAEDGGRMGSVDRNPGAAGARPPGARRHPCCARAAGTRPDAGRAGGLRPHVRGRRPAHGAPAARSRRVAGSCPTIPARCWRPWRRAPEERRRIATPRLPAAQPLIEPLSERELDVLRLLSDRAFRAGDRPRARGRLEHGAHPHQEHLQQARRQQSPGGRQTGRGAGSALSLRGRAVCCRRQATRRQPLAGLLSNLARLREGSCPSHLRLPPHITHINPHMWGRHLPTSTRIV